MGKVGSGQSAAHGTWRGRVGGGVQQLSKVGGIGWTWREITRPHQPLAVWVFICFPSIIANGTCFSSQENVRLAGAMWCPHPWGPVPVEP